MMQGLVSRTDWGDWLGRIGFGGTLMAWLLCHLSSAGHVVTLLAWTSLLALALFFVRQVMLTVAGRYADVHPLPGHLLLVVAVVMNVAMLVQSIGAPLV